MDFADSLAQLEITIGDSASITFTPEEKERALKKAWNDSFVVKVVMDTSTVWATNMFSYPMPTGMSAVKDIYTKDSVDSGAEPISADEWEVVNGNILFNTSASYLYSPGAAVYIKGVQKLDWATDTIDDTNMQEYVLASAGYNTLTALSYKKANLFLKNDVTMSELIGLRRELDAERKELRGKLLRETQGA